MTATDRKTNALIMESDGRPMEYDLGYVMFKFHRDSDGNPLPADALAALEQENIDHKETEKQKRQRKRNTELRKCEQRVSALKRRRTQ